MLIENFSIKKLTIIVGLHYTSSGYRPHALHYNGILVDPWLKQKNRGGGEQKT